MCRLKTSAKNIDDLSIRFDFDRVRKQRLLTNNKIQKRKYHVRNMPKDRFGYALHQEKATYGLG